MLWSTIKPEGVLFIVYGKVGLPSRQKDKVTGCNGKQELLSVSLNTDAETEMPSELNPNHYLTVRTIYCV